MKLSFLRPLCRDRFLHLLLLIGLVLVFMVPFAPLSWPRAIDWHTIITLSGLMLLTKGVELSGYFDVLGRRMVQGFKTERQLALFMVITAAILSTFLTNDVALFIVVPLTITLKKLCHIPVNRLIIFEALAVNAGSLLTPIGNPQNILLWGHSGLSFFAFMMQMLPLMLLTMITLLVLCGICFSSKKLSYQTVSEMPAWQPRRVWCCRVFYLLFIAALELRQEIWGLLAVAAGFAVLARRVILSVDWTLLLIFILMFIDIHLLIHIPALNEMLSATQSLSAAEFWLTAIGISQTISNVPATILLLNYYSPDTLFAWAVNIGGFGLLPSSLANLIALRMANNRLIWWQFHLYSIPLLVWTAAMGYGLYRVCM